MQIVVIWVIGNTKNKLLFVKRSIILNPVLIGAIFPTELLYFSCLDKTTKLQIPENNHFIMNNFIVRWSGRAGWFNIHTSFQLCSRKQRVMHNGKKKVFDVVNTENQYFFHSKCSKSATYTFSIIQVSKVALNVIYLSKWGCGLNSIYRKVVISSRGYY